MKILIAEDQPSSASLIRPAARADRFPLIISDWVMPGMDGLELCRKVREKGGKPYCSLILPTSKQSHGDRLEGLRAAADAELARDMAERLRSALTNREWTRGPVTASFGIATALHGAGTPPELIDQADRALYRSKKPGRDRVSYIDDPELDPVTSEGSCH